MESRGRRRAHSDAVKRTGRAMLGRVYMSVASRSPRRERATRDEVGGLLVVEAALQLAPAPSTWPELGRTAGGGGSTRDGR